MSRDGHDYDMGFHAPWCAKCGAEDDARCDAEYAFEHDQWEAMLAVMARLKAACEVTVPYGAAIEKANEIEGLAIELGDLAQQKFSWPDNRTFEP